MVRTLSGAKVRVVVAANLVNKLDDGKEAQVAHPDLNYALSLSAGIGAKQADRAYQIVGRRLNQNETDEFSLYDFAEMDIGAGAGKDGLGQAVVNEEIVAIAIVNENAVTDPGELEVTEGATNGFTALGNHTVSNGGALRGQGLLLKVQPAEDGLRVVAESKERLKLKAVNGSVVYSLYLLFRHDWEESSSSSSSSSSRSSISTSSSSSSS